MRETVFELRDSQVVTGAPWFLLLRISSRKLATRMSASKTTFVGDLSTLDRAYAPTASTSSRARR